MFQIKAKVLGNKEIAEDHYRMVLDAKDIAKVATPGQFVHIRVSEMYDPFLRRPFSIHRIGRRRGKRSNAIEILYKVVGKGTDLLRKKEVGEELDILGPLGNGFKIRWKEEKIVLVAGGIGIAPLLFLAEDILITHHSSLITILIGAKSRSEVLCEEEFKSLAQEVQIATEDGSYGHKGIVTDLLKDLLRSHSSLLTTYACGPFQMLKEVARLCSEYKIPCQVSLDRRMGCGVGVCLGCVVKTTNLYKRVCRDGPVFNSREIIWE